MDIDRRWLLYTLYSGISASIVFVIGTIIAMLTYPNYSISGNFFSDTGLRIDQQSLFSDEIIKAHPYPEIFNTTLYVTAILLLPFFLSLPIIMNRELDASTPSKILYWICTGWGLIIVPATIAVGIYDWGTNLTAHVIAAQTTLSGILLFVLTWAVADFFLNEDHVYKHKSNLQLDLVVSAFIIACSYTQTGLPVPGFMTAYVTLQIYQKLAIYSALIYVAIIARRLLPIVSGSTNTIVE